MSFTLLFDVAVARLRRLSHDEMSLENTFISITEQKEIFFIQDKEKEEGKKLLLEAT